MPSVLRGSVLHLRPPPQAEKHFSPPRGFRVFRQAFLQKGRHSRAAALCFRHTVPFPFAVRVSSGTPRRSVRPLPSSHGQRGVIAPPGLPRRAVFGFFARPFCKKAASPCRSALLPAHCAFSVRRPHPPATSSRRPNRSRARSGRCCFGLPLFSSGDANRSRARSGRCPHGCLPGRSNASARLPWPHCPRRETAAEW